jgi:3-hydroxybutyryl-CoA dehydrogenase
MEKIVVIGTGTMAAGIGAGFIQAGLQVVFLGRSLDKAEQAASEAGRLASALVGKAQGSPLGDPLGAHLPALAGLTDSWNDWRDTVLVIETIVEDLELKRQLFASLDSRVPPGVPIGSNSSSFPITRIAQGLASRSRMFNTHYFMPAHLVPLVEVALGDDSDAAIAEPVCALYRRIGKRPVFVRKDIPGFLANRIQHALMREALSLIDSGIATAEDVDTAVRYSFGFRYVAAGPILQKEISGWDVTSQAAAEIYPWLSNTKTVSACLASLVAQGKTGMKSGAGFMSWPPDVARQEKLAYDKRLKAAFDVLTLDERAEK